MTITPVAQKHGKISLCSVFALSLSGILSGCGVGTPCTGDDCEPEGTPPVPKVTLNDTGVTYFIDDTNVPFIEEISSKDWFYESPVSITSEEFKNYQKSGSPRLYNAFEQSMFPKIPIDAFAQQASQPANFPGQDGASGRDTNVNDPNDGVAGFSFTKLDAGTGAELNSTATEYGCVRDNVTGLIWEHKTNNPASQDWHSGKAYFTWYDTNTNTNGGHPGEDADNTLCARSLIKGDTQDLINISNSEQLCGITKWRLPTLEELRSIVNYQVKRGTLPQPAMTDQTYFPYVAITGHKWTSQTVNMDNQRHKAFGFHFHEGQVQPHEKVCLPTNQNGEKQTYDNGALLVADPSS